MRLILSVMRVPSLFKILRSRRAICRLRKQSAQERPNSIIFPSAKQESPIITFITNKADCNVHVYHYSVAEVEERIFWLGRFFKIDLERVWGFTYSQVF